MRFYVYVIFRPDGRPCYVGKGTGVRWTRKHDNNRHLSNIRAAAGKPLPVVKVAVGLTEDEAFAYERAFIAAIGRTPNGPLVNATDGGEGNTSGPMPEEQKQKIREAMLGNPNVSAAQIARFARKEERDRITEIARARGGPPPEHMERLRALHTGKKRPPGTGEKISAALKARLIASPEARRQLADAVEASRTDTARSKRTGRPVSNKRKGELQ